MNHYQVVAACIRKDKKILSVQKGKNSYDYISEKWEFPGGKIEAGETEEEALKREIFEELSMSILVEKKLMTINHSYPDFQLTMAVFLCSSKDEPILSEHIQYKWLDPSELASLDWAAADVPVIDRLIVNNVF
jgi:8-oxo-dGTP diphosphatase